MRCLAHMTNEKTAEAALAGRFRAMVRDRAYPCVGAKAALNGNGMRILVARDIASAWDDLAIHRALAETAEAHRRQGDAFRTLVVLFAEARVLDEAEYERLMWERIQSLADKDEWRGHAPDPDVSNDPEDPHFSLSFGGEAFFVVGLHPRASRPARRFEVPVMVFNLHAQFERLRADGRYETMRETILARDVKVAGSVNPMLARHGESSEARQYSGRVVDEEWRCPFARRSVGELAEGVGGERADR